MKKVAENGVVVTALTHLLDGDILEPQVDAWANRIRDSRDSWYAQIEAKEGASVAEERLKELSAGQHRVEFAGSLRPIVAGLKVLAEVDENSKEKTKLFSMGGDCRNIVYPVDYKLRDSCNMIVAFNPQLWSCGCNPIPGAYQWGRAGTLGLEAIVICFDKVFSKLTLDLVFESRIKNRMRPNNDGAEFGRLAILSIARDGDVDPKGIWLEVYSEPYLRYALGVVDGKNLFRNPSHSGGHVDETMGFPGALEYIAKNISELGKYLEESAKRLTKNHKHK